MASVKKNYLYNLTAQLLTIILPLVTTPYVTRVLGNENLGIFSYAQSIVNYFILFGCIGLNTYAQREIAFHKDDRYKQSVAFAEVVCVRVVTIALSIIVYWVMIVRTADHPLYYSILGLELLAALLDISWFLQGNENFRSHMIRTIITRLLGLACVFLFVKKEADLYLYILCCSGAILAGNLSLWLSVKKNLQRICWKEIRPLRHLKPALILFLPHIAVSVYTQLDKTMIGILTSHDYNEVGYYSQAEKIVKMAMTVVTSMGGIMLSRVTVALSHNDSNAAVDYIKKSFRFMFLMGCPIAFGLAAISSDMVPWFFGDGYDPVIPCMMMLSPLVIIIGISNVFGTQYMIPTRRMKEYTTSILSGMVVNVLLNILLIPKFGAMGAVFATLLAEITVSLRQYCYLKDIFDLSVLFSGVQNFAAAAVMGAGVFALSLYLPATWWSTTLEITAGIAIYYVILLMLKDQLMLDLLGRVGRKFR